MDSVKNGTDVQRLARSGSYLAWSQGVVRIASGVSWLRVDIDGRRIAGLRGPSEMRRAYELVAGLRSQASENSPDRGILLALCGVAGHTLSRDISAELHGWLAALAGEHVPCGDNYQPELVAVCPGPRLLLAGTMALDIAEAAILRDQLIRVAPLDAEPSCSLEIAAGRISISANNPSHYGWLAMYDGQSRTHPPVAKKVVMLAGYSMLRLAADIEAALCGVRG